MKKITLDHVAVIVTSLIALVSFKSKTSNQVLDTFRVGDVVYSVLKIDDFKKEHAGDWMVLGGDPLPNDQTLSSRYLIKYKIAKHADGRVLLPDARGVFIRGMNLGREVQYGDAEGDREIGKPQADAVGPHKHQQSTTASIDPNGTTSSVADRSRGESIKDPKLFTLNNEGNETRPRNITLYVYIKTND